MRCRGFTAGFAALAWLLAASAQAHKPSDSYLVLRPEGPSALRGSWDLALRDLDRAFALDRDGDGALRWGELRAREPELARYAMARLGLARGARACALEPGELGLVTHSDGPYARLPFRAFCPGSEHALSLRYDFFFELDPQHRAVVRVAQSGQGADDTTFVLREQARSVRLPLGAGRAAQSALSLVRSGVEHIVFGFDHVLFLLALLLPSVLRATAPAGAGADGAARGATSAALRRVLVDVVKLVSAFTVAHSLTLGLSALGLLRVSASAIEPAIAASVALAAADNLWPVFGSERWSVALVLGLLHGFGFSAALSDLGLERPALVRALFLFNAGVELGQLTIVALFVPLAFLLRERWGYRALAVRGGSLAIVAVSLLWFWERI